MSRSPGLPLLQGERCCIGSRKLAPLARDHISACLRPQLLGAVFGCPCVMHMRAAGRALSAERGMVRAHTSLIGQVDFFVCYMFRALFSEILGFRQQFNDIFKGA